MQENRLDPAYLAYHGWALFLLSPEEYTTQAKRAIQQSLTFQDDLDYPYYFLGRIHAVNNDLVTAKNFLKKALDINPDHKEAAQELKKLERRPTKPPDRPSLTDVLTGWTRKKK